MTLRSTEGQLATSSLPAIRSEHHVDPPNTIRRRHSLVECHGREIACGPANQHHAVTGPKAAIDKKSDVSLHGGQVQLQVVVAEHRRDGYIAAAQAVQSRLPVHPASSLV